MKNRQIIVQTLPTGALGPEHFALEDAPMPVPADGELLVKVILMSIDAANRSWLQGATYRAAVKAGDAMPTYAVAQVVESRSDRFAPGDLVTTEATWCDYAAVPARGAVKIPALGPLSHRMSVFGIAGKTALHGLIDVGRVLAGETVLVSAAAGSVGGYVGQIAKAMGCRVVGIAGGAEKCAWVTGALGFDDCVDYKDPAFAKALRAACPGGVDVYFDNVGGAVLESALFSMKDRGRVVCCGAISQYDGDAPSGPRNLPGLVVVKRLRMEGFIVTDFHRDAPRAEAALAAWLQEGRIKVFEDITEGLDSAPQALIGLLAGENRGKRMVRVAPDPA
jgi:NADPH-dependent curcumin reductase CurA